MAKYLSPCSDIVFKKVFGEHPDLLISFLNSVLPLPEDRLIKKIEYLPADHIPQIPEFKYSIVDVKCTDQQGRIFVVEMQITWHPRFKQRMLFNASHAYVKQLQKGETYDLLNPVYGLGILGENFTIEPDWYHHYKLVNVQDTRKTINDLQLVFLELPKFKASNLGERKLTVLWLRFMAEINEQTIEVDPMLSEVPEIKKALSLVEESSYTKSELEYYDSYWDAVSREKSLVKDMKAIGKAEGKIEGKAELIQTMLNNGQSIDLIAKLTGLSETEIKDLIK